MEEGRRFLAETYRRLPVTLVRGEGCTVWDENGRAYVDLISGIATVSLGHVHPELVAAAREALGRLWHVSNLFWTVPQAELARELSRRSIGGRVFFCNSGAEAVEAALKMARRYAWKRFGPGRYEIVALEGSFHGRTFGALSATGQPVYHQGFRPLLPGVTHVPRNDLEALERAIIPGRAAAILLEPVQGEGGVHVLSDEFLLRARELATRHGIPLIFDEIQTGMGRTGTLFAYEGTPVAPDAICLAKALSNGLPIGALIAKDEFIEALGPGTHASTFGGGPVVCTVALKALEIVSDPGFLKAVREKGELLRSGLLRIAEALPHLVREVRGRGLMLALEFRSPVKGLFEALRERGYLALVVGDRLLRLLPPLIISENELSGFLSALEDALSGLGRPERGGDA